MNDLNMSVEELMDIDIDNLIEKQHDVLKSHTINILENVIDMIKDERYEELENMLVYSPSGDGYGCDNHFINFSYTNDDTEDLESRLCDLMTLKRKM